MVADLEGEPHGVVAAAHAGAARRAQPLVGLAAALQQVVDQRLDLLVGQAALERAASRSAKPLTMKAPGSSIDSRTYSSADLPGSHVRRPAVFSSSRFGPIVPFEPAGPNVWQPGAAGGGEDLLAGLGLGEAGRGERALVVARLAAAA